MKRIPALFALFFCALFCTAPGAHGTEISGVFEETEIDVSKIFGRIRVVENREDADFCVLPSFGKVDLEVTVVRCSPNNCGEWQFVGENEDFKICFVNSAWDFVVEITSLF